MSFALPKVFVRPLFCMSNNLAVIFFKMEKFTLSSLYLAKASQANDDDLQQLPRVDSQLNGRPLITLGLSKKCQLLRNFGVVKLFAGQNKEGRKVKLI